MAQHHIALSGAQGGGKSSLLAELSRRGYDVDQFRVSRAVQSQLGWESLDRVMESPRTMMEFQEEVYQQKYANDRALHFNSNVYTFVERSFADIAAYTTTWMWKFVDRGDISLNEAMGWLSGYLKRCALAQREVYSATIILPLMEHVVFENDPHRAKKEDVDEVFENLQRFLDLPDFLTQPKLLITTRTIEERADQVEAFVRKL